MRRMETTKDDGDLAYQRLVAASQRIREAARARGRTGTSHNDADDEAGTFATDGALGFDPLPLLRALHANGARAVVIGQIASIMHGDDELTGDLDLLWDGDQAAALSAAFRSMEARLSDDDGCGVEVNEAAFALPKVLYSTESASGDCCTLQLPWGGSDPSEMLARAEVAHGPEGLKVYYLALDDLILLREMLGRPKDLRRLARLRELRGY